MSNRSSQKSVFTHLVREPRRFNTKRLTALRRVRTLVPALLVAVAAALIAGVLLVQAANQTWDGGTSGNGTAWYSATNWVGDAPFPGSQATTTNTDIASIGSTGTNPDIGINGTTSATLFLGAIDFSGANRGIGDSAAGSVTFTLNGASVNSVSNVIVRNSGTGTLTLKPQAGGAGTLSIALGNATDNVINIGSTGGVTISSMIKNAGGNHITVGGGGTGTLTLSGANTYTGGTTINSAKVAAAVNSALGTGNVTVNTTGVGLTLQGAFNNYISDSATLNISSGAMVALNQTGGSDAIGSLVLGGVTQTAPGTYGSSASGATNQFDSFFTGTGTVTLAAAPTLNINDVTQAEGNSGMTAFNFTVSLTAAAAANVTFTVNTADGSATIADNDYAAIVNGAGTITAGNTSTTVTVNVNGDTTSEPNETFFVNITNVSAGATAGDLQGLGTITNDDVTITKIYSIQGSGNTSPFNTQSVTTTGIVTGRKTNGFFIQDPNGDGNANTSDAIFVFTSSAPSATIAVGDSVQVTGTVTEFILPTSEEPATAADPRTATEIVSPTTVIVSSGNSLPAALDAVSLNIFDPAATSRSAELEKYEFMRVTAGSITVSEPTNNFGEFWGVVTGVPRPFREPGIERGDPIPAADEGAFAGTPPPNVPIFDGNFERIQVDSDDATSSANARRTGINVTTGAIVTGIVGPLDYAFDSYRIVLDFSAVPGITPGITVAVPVPPPTTQEFTVGHANLENFTNNANRLNKASLAIRNVMRTPDILGIIEVDNATTATALANKVNADAASASVNYVAYFSETAASQDIGYLVNTARVTVVGTPTAYNSAATFTYCGVTGTLHDRPSFVLTATLPQFGGGTIPVTTILNHTKSLIAVDSPLPYGTCGTGTEGARNREKRRLQAEDLADLIQTHIYEKLAVLGDLNAFDFNDGLGDVVGTLRGVPAPANQVVEPSTDRWPYQLTNLLYTVPANEQYSLLFEGNAQALDHILVSNSLLVRNTRFAFARYDSDFSPDYAADANRPEALSDHDAPVAYFGNGPTAADGTVSGRVTDPNGVPVAGAVVNLSGTQDRKFITDANGDYRFENVETNGFYTVKPTLENYSFSPAEQSFSQLGNNTEAVFTASRTGGSVNALDTAEYFVRQHYLDFLGREPDESGFNFWSDQILECGGDAGCTERRTVNVSAAYFQSIEFQRTGGLVDRLYRASYGRNPRYAEFMPDRDVITRDVVVGRSGWERQLAANEKSFVDNWVTRRAFEDAFSGLSNAGYVDRLLSNAGVRFSQAERDSLVSSLSGGALSRAEVLQQIAASESFAKARFNEAFVMMEYFGYLRRDPDAEGYRYWLGKLNQFDGNFERAEMVKAFISSAEYRGRFQR